MEYYLLILFLFFKFCNSCTSTSKNLSPVYDSLLKPTLEAAKGIMSNFSEQLPSDFNEQLDAAYGNEDIYLNITQLLTKYGYNVEQHLVTTCDGYLLDIFRIPGNGTVVFLMHGILSSSDDFVTSGPDRGLAYMLANQGYDVWLGNARGTAYGRKHDTMSPDCAEFWDFSWDEIGRYDLPATIDYILKATGKEKLAYVGHSQGCTSFFVLTSEFPEYNDKISVMVALSAVAYLEHSESLVFRILAPIADTLYQTLKSYGLYELAPRIKDSNFNTADCGTSAAATAFCYDVVASAFSANIEQVNTTILPVYYGHFPAGISVKQGIHYLQLITSGKFRNFDYDIEENLQKYGLISPPDYCLNKITSKIVVFHSDNDVMSSTPDRERLIAQLPNVVETYRVPCPLFVHGDYLMANDLKTLVNDKVLAVIKTYV